MDHAIAPSRIGKQLSLDRIAKDQTMKNRARMLSLSVHLKKLGSRFLQKLFSEG